MKTTKTVAMPGMNFSCVVWLGSRENSCAIGSRM